MTHEEFDSISAGDLIVAERTPGWIAFLVIHVSVHPYPGRIYVLQGSEASKLTWFLRNWESLARGQYELIPKHTA